MKDASDPMERGWVLCANCRRPRYGRSHVRGLRVCSGCGWHQPLTARQRLEQLVDEGRFLPLDNPPTVPDPLGFVDTMPYPDRLAQARARTGMEDAVLCARAAIHDQPAIVAVMDFRFMGGSLGSAVGEWITRAAEISLAERLPLIIVTASGGARMQEGALSLMQMAKTSAALGELDRAGILTISLITDPTFGGVAASFAVLTDVIIAEPGARLGFAGPRVIQQTIRRSLPPGFQTAEFLLERGFIDLIAPRPRLRSVVGALLRAAGHATSVGGLNGAGGPDPVVRDPGLLPEPDPWAHVAAARHLSRPTTLDYLALAFDDFQELHGDRVSGECPAVVGGTAWLDGRPVVVIGHQKGHSLPDLERRNFGMPTPAGYRKAARLMRLAEKLRLPVVTLVDTPGAYPGPEAEERGQAVAIAENLKLMASLTVPVVTVITGEGGSGGALAMAVANRVLMFSHSVYSVISPEGCASILWKDAAAAPRAAQALGLSARDLLRHGVVDGVLPEPDGGVGAAPQQAAEALRAALSRELRDLAQMTPEELRRDRHERFRRYGTSSAMLAPAAH